MTAAAVVAAANARARRELAQGLRDAGAISEATATRYQPASRLGERLLPRMIREGVVHETSSGGLWLDEAAYAAHQAKQRRFARIAVTLVVLMTAVAVLIGLGLGAQR